MSGSTTRGSRIRQRQNKLTVEKKDQRRSAQRLRNSSGLAAGAGASEDTVQHRLEASSKQRITTFAEMQPIGRDRHAELPIAVEQRIADFGINNVLTVGAGPNKAIHLHDRPAERANGGLLPGTQPEQPII